MSASPNDLTRFVDRTKRGDAVNLDGPWFERLTDEQAARLVPKVPTPYTGSICTRRDHARRGDIPEKDTRRHRCDCGLVMIGSGHVEIRFGLLPELYPDEAPPCRNTI